MVLLLVLIEERIFFSRFDDESVAEVDDGGSVLGSQPVLRIFRKAIVVCWWVLSSVRCVFQGTDGIFGETNGSCVVIWTSDDDAVRVLFEKSKWSVM